MVWAGVSFFFYSNEAISYTVSLSNFLYFLNISIISKRVLSFKFFDSGNLLVKACACGYWDSSEELLSNCFSLF